MIWGYHYFQKHPYGIELRSALLLSHEVHQSCMIVCTLDYVDTK